MNDQVNEKMSKSMNALVGWLGGTWPPLNPQSTVTSPSNELSSSLSCNPSPHGDQGQLGRPYTEKQNSGPRERQDHDQHRQPWQQLDSILTASPGPSGLARKDIPGDTGGEPGCDITQLQKP